MIIKNMYKILYAQDSDQRHVWSIKMSVNNGMFFIYNKRTKLTWQVLAREMVYGTASIHKDANIFPDYIHDFLWKLHDYARGLK